jgi:hypothetical protein
MRLADFIDANMPAILVQWELFASSLMPAAAGLDAAALRDHAEQILLAIAKDGAFWPTILSLFHHGI